MDICRTASPVEAARDSNAGFPSKTMKNFEYEKHMLIKNARSK